MSAEPVLRLVAAEPAAAEAIPAAPPVAPAAAPPLARLSRPQRITAQRLRRVCLGAWTAAAAGGLCFLAFWPLLPSAWDVGAAVAGLLAVLWLLVFPSAGLVLLLNAAANRTREDAQALLAAALLVAGLIALTGRASDTAAEIYLARHAPEMEWLARHPDRRSASLSLDGPRDAREGKVFTLRGLTYRQLLYASPTLDEALGGCKTPDVEPLGGRWYLYRCL